MKNTVVLSCNTVSFGKLSLPLVSADFLLGLLFDPEEATCSSETPGSVQSTRRYNPEVRILHSHRRDNLKFNILTDISSNFP
jgi:hypothetical protein